MKKLFYFLAIPTFMVVACQQQELPQVNDNQDQIGSSDIQVKDGYLNFATDDIFEEYLLSLEHLKEEASPTTRGTTRSFNGFTSISALKKTQANTRTTNNEDDEEMTVDEYNLMKAENLLVDPILEEIMDTTLRIGIADRVFQVTEHGTFSANSLNATYIKDAIEKFDTMLVHSSKNGAYIELPNGVTFTNTFGPGSIEQSELEPINETATRSIASDLHNGYNVNTYSWKNNSLWQNFWDKIRGKDVTKENNFDSNKRVQVNVFDINYAFYASAGIKVKMQKRKKIWFVRYWVSEDADKLAIGFNKVYGVMHYNNPRSFSSITPTNSTRWGTFTGAINGIPSNFIFGNYKKLGVVKDWVEDIYMFLPEIKLFGQIYPNKEMMNKLYNAPAQEVHRFLKSQTGKYVFDPIKKQIQPKDPRVSYIVWGNTDRTYDKEKPYIMGVKEYGRGSSKTVRFDRSFGFSFNNGSVSGFLPSEFDIKDIDAFGAAYYNGKWRGVRFIK